MGFGTLFIGYFLLLNLTYYGFTDIIAAAIMLLGLYKLSSVNKQFKIAAIAAAVFLVFSLGEFGVATYELFVKRTDSATFVSVMSILRCVAVCALTFLSLKGMEAVAKEVEVENIPEKAARLSKVTAVVYCAWIILEAPLSFINDYVLAVLSLVTIIATIALIISNLTVIYGCYMRLCMPGDENLTDKPSRFEFVNEYRARKAERDAAAMEERMKLARERAKKKGKKK